MQTLPQGLRAVGLLGIIAGALPAAAMGKPLASSFLGSRSRAAPTACTDEPGWEDSRKYPCDVYVSQNYCTAAGGEGNGWVPLWGTLDDFKGTNDLSATKACCGCGGGKQEPLPQCDLFKCPTGFLAKKDASAAFCTRLECDGEEDMVTCCETDPAVQNAVEQMKVLIQEKADETAKSIADIGEGEVTKTVASVTQYRDKQIQELQAKLEDKRAAALGDASKWFSEKTGDQGGNLVQAAQHEITAVGYMAARAAAHDGEAKVNEKVVEENAKGVKDEFNGALSAWKSASTIGGSASKTGLREFEDYYKDLNATWPVIVQGIKAANEALDSTEGPGQATRWAKETTRLTTDLSQMVDAHATSVNMQVQAAKMSADQALGATGGNRVKVIVLEALVDKAAKSMM
jgi:hypothetical protein